VPLLASGASPDRTTEQFTALFPSKETP
jgi:hypothetical protein